MLKFLNLKPEIFGIDINDLSLRIIKLQKKRKGFSIVSFNDVDVAPGIVKEGVIQNDVSLSKIISMACSTVHGQELGTKYVVVSLPEEKSFSQVIQMPKMTEDELKLAVPFEAENYIPLPIEKAYLDFQVIDYHKDNSNHLDLLINVMPRPIIDSYVSCFKKIGLSPCILEVESQSIVRVLTRNNEKTLPTIFVDFGETKTGLIVHSENSIRFTVTVPISSSQLTSAISESLGISFGAAEKLKIQHGLNKSSIRVGNIASAMMPILSNLAEQIKKYLDFYQGHSSHEYFPSGGMVKKVVLCGGGSNLKGLAEFLLKKLNIPVELGDPLVNILKDRNDLFPRNKALSFGTAMGSALRGASDTYLNSYSDNI
ncbi:MAG: type IV pilus assembly protein PilM [Patescibacteria group bacterium]